MKTSRDVALCCCARASGNGVLDVFSLPLDEVEQSQLQRSAQVVRQAIVELET